MARVMRYTEPIPVKVSSPPTVEIDTAAKSAYVRFQNRKVAKTVSVDHPGKTVIAIDLDEKNQVIGVELIGVSEFSVRTLLLKVPITVSRPEILSQTRYVSATKRNAETLEPA